MWPLGSHIWTLHVCAWLVVLFREVMEPGGKSLAGRSASFCGLWEFAALPHVQFTISALLRLKVCAQLPALEVFAIPPPLEPQAKIISTKSRSVVIFDHSNRRSNKYIGLGGQKERNNCNWVYEYVIGVGPPKQVRSDTNGGNRAWPSYLYIDPANS